MKSLTILTASSTLLVLAAASIAPIPKGSSCLETTAPCEEGTICAGTSTKKKCIRPMQLGQRCGGDPFWVCAETLICRNHLCQERDIPDGGDCTPEGSTCEDGTVCTGSDDSKMCVVPGSIGDTCGTDEFDICNDGLACNAGTCALPAIPEGGNCSKEGSVCVDGTICAGKKSRKRCVKPIPQGGACTRKAFSICNEGLECVKRKCVPPAMVEGGDCALEGSMCVPGTVCAGDEASKRCVLPSESGDPCGSGPFEVCGTGLTCSDYTCKPPVISEGGSCKKDGSVCVDGTVCVGHKYKEKCVAPGVPGDSCGMNQFQVCGDGLECMGSICKPPVVTEGGDCLPDGSMCVHGAVCLGTDSEKKCVVPEMAGGDCSPDDVFSICKDDLVCKQQKCMMPMVPESGDCTAEGSVCVDGTKCIGTENKKVCVEPQPMGGVCSNVDVFSICAEGLICENDTCSKPKIPKGGDCTQHGSMCIDDTVCVGTDTEKECVMPAPMGGDCSKDDPLSICAETFVCENHKCMKPKVPKGGDCLLDGSVCVEGTVCVGTDTEKECVMPAPMGGDCSNEDPFSICADNLVCDNHKCMKPKVPEGGDCLLEESVCVEGTECIGIDTKNECVMPAPMGGDCSNEDPFSICADNLVCDNHKCMNPKVPKGGDCLLDGSVCVDGTVCVGTDNEKECVMQAPMGGDCSNDDPFSICADKLVCEDHRCMKPKIPEGGDCLLDGSVCVDGTECVGTDTEKECVQPTPIGGDCMVDDPFSLCADDLVCDTGNCMKPKVPKGGNCLPGGSVCVEGNECAGTDTEKKCVMPTPMGGECANDTPFSICADGLSCEDGKCMTPLIPENDDCTGMETRCVDGTACVGTSSRKICRKPMGDGQGCGLDPYWVCQDHLECVKNVCREQRVPRNGDCLSDDAVCDEDLVCAGTPSRKLCVEPMGTGKRCGVDPYWVCVEGLECLSNTCQAPKIPRNGDCTVEGSQCGAGTVCAGTSTRKLCVVPMGIGKTCGTDPYWVCQSGVTCSSHRCVASAGGEGHYCGSGRPCSSGLYCAYGWGRSARCTKPAGIGHSCGRSRPCDRGLTCRWGRCNRSSYRRW